MVEPIISKKSYLDYRGRVTLPLEIRAIIGIKRDQNVKVSLVSLKQHNEKKTWKISIEPLEE